MQPTNSHSIIEITMGPELGVTIIYLHKGVFLGLKVAIMQIFS